MYNDRFEQKWNFFEQKWKKSIHKSMGCHQVPLDHESFHLEFSFISMFFSWNFLIHLVFWLFHCSDKIELSEKNHKQKNMVIS